MALMPEQEADRLDELYTKITPTVNPDKPGIFARQKDMVVVLDEVQKMNDIKEKTHFESLVESLNQAIDYEKGNKKLARVRLAAIPEIEPRRSPY